MMNETIIGMLVLVALIQIAIYAKVSVKAKQTKDVLSANGLPKHIDERIDWLESELSEVYTIIDNTNRVLIEILKERSNKDEQEDSNTTDV